MSQLVLIAIVAAAAIFFYRRITEPRAPNVGQKSDDPRVSDLKKCDVCGTYVAERGAAPCDNASCPHNSQ